MPLPANDVAQRIARELRLLAIHTVVYSHQASSALGLSGTESEVLNLLGLEGARTAGEIARATGLSSGTTTGVLDRLEERGYIRRERDSADRRKVLVTADPDALTRVGAMFDAHEQTLSAVLREYEEDQLENVAEFLARLTEAAKQHPFTPEPSTPQP
ncbi:MarR family winged helix-turn-helix transcriptional regulator [Nocardia sp. NPDC060256]|uniref:MarR family winged helix-turn-helix transcriptional regulator n=1 Tax=unclassified Nocardia TaxID=2637762 RepID=UPI003653A7F1